MDSGESACSYDESQSSVVCAEGDYDDDDEDGDERVLDEERPRARGRKRRTRVSVVPRVHARCWFCEFHTHPFVSQISVAVIENLKDTSAESVAAMVCSLVADNVASNEVDIDTNCFTVDEASVLRHITEHIVDTRVQFPHMIRSLQEVYGDMRKSLYVVSSDDECDGEGVSVEQRVRVPNKAGVDAMVRISSQLAVLYKINNALSSKDSGA